MLVKTIASRCNGNSSGFNAQMGLGIAWKVCQVMSKYKFKRVVAQVSQNDRLNGARDRMEANRLLCVVFGNSGGFNARMGPVIAYKEFEWIQCLNLSRDRIEELKKCKLKRVVAQASQDDRYALYLGIQVYLRLEWGS
ncbi:uncharacterized protein G2W53_001255 [Senna tora]|uniref:Uncharacterized protein n=1 Tax=Senna tora TaxID=362788 RepID=A0A835CLC0_9FABA|nr:uncharacterized protein G2W53_001255 [Senna tora]